MTATRLEENIDSVNSLIHDSSGIRYYVNSYVNAKKSKIVDTTLFADREAQDEFYDGKIAEHKDKLRANLQSQKSYLTARLSLVAKEEQEAVYAAIDGVESEFKKL